MQNGPDGDDNDNTDTAILCLMDQNCALFDIDEYLASNMLQSSQV